MTGPILAGDIDLYRAAKLYIDRHGDQASIQAAMQADALLAAGDLDGAATLAEGHQGD